MSASPRNIPLTARLVFSAWMVFWVAVVMTHHGPQNFFWLCNLAQFIILYAIWRGNRLLLSSQAGLVCLVGLVWTLDLVVALILGGHSLTGFTAYMYSDELPLIARAVSLYHVFLPPFLLWLVWRRGYDGRGVWLQCVIGAAGVIGGWLWTEPWRNVNWVHEFFGTEQVWMPDPLWVALLVIAYPLLIFLPGHFLVRWCLSKAP
ncbi:hypothetical protein IC757_11895 [Wenzhouxiangella sp. AB-CW3]|uniref:hypothetical protein n=1 Tax=Wenzhouxiangella sp. AB-CW3 TaxID=2771012 RepID=UPI00168B41A9|nr:hypothetical protein [Wenzhouxiangella sp. AB-CW3]QOC21739.1 hypothetical protein IC757_11895 [Wenzhouxiangella sp. AB-CW3]